MRLTEFELELRCSVCRGDGVVDVEEDPTSPAVECGECEGLGYRPTDLGEEVLALVLRHLPRHVLDATAQARKERTEGK